MDNDKQVKDLVQDTRDRFLNQPLQPDDRDRDGFDLEREFAKSAKNRSLLIPVAVAVFLVLLGVGAWVASQFTEQASQKSTVSIGSFEDLKLKEIFDTARKNKKDLEAIQAQIGELRRVSDAKIVALRQAGSSKADIASVNDASGAQAKAILTQTEQAVSAEKASLAAALKPLQAQADDVQKKIDSYDDRIGQLNKKNQQVLDSQQRLFDLEKQKLTDQYEARLAQQAQDAQATADRLKKEKVDLVTALNAKHAEDIRKLILKYNPVIVEPLFTGLLTTYGTKAAAYPDLTLLPDRIASRSLLSADLQATLAARVDRTRQLLARLKAIPYENSVPPLLNAVDNALAEALVGFNGYLAPLAAHMVDLDTVIAQRDATIAALKDTVAAREATIEGLKADLAQRDADIAQGKADLAQEKADRKADVAAEKDRARAQVARWTNPVEDYVATLKDDGVLGDVRTAGEVLVVLRADKAKALIAAASAAQAAGTAVPVVTASVRDGVGGAELGTLTLEAGTGSAWIGRSAKVNDPKKPFKAFDRVVLVTTAKK